MKNYFFFLAITLLLTSFGERGLAQVYDGDLWLTTQAAVNAFNYTEVTGNLRIQGIHNNSIKNLNGLSELVTVGGHLDIVYNSVLTSLMGLEKITSVGGYYRINNNSGLTNLVGLDALTSVGSSLIIEDNNGLTSLTGLQALTTVGGSLDIVSNASLITLTGLETLTSVSRMSITSNASLTSLTGLNAITSNGGGFEIVSNASLRSLTGLEALTSTGGFIISSNASLTTLTGLEGLTSVRGTLGIFSNASLTSLTGLDNIATGLINNLYIGSNPNLSTCEVQSMCNYLVVPSNFANVSNNATNCADRPAVLAACRTLPVETVDYQSTLQVYPNPVQGGLLNINFATKQDAAATLRIFDVHGKMLHQKTLANQYNQTECGYLPAGMYFLEVRSKSKVWRERLVVQ